MIEAVIIENLKKIILKNNIRFNLYEELKFKKAEYYIEKYGNEVILGPDYETKNRFNRSKWRKKLQGLSILIFRIDNPFIFNAKDNMIIKPSLLFVLS